MIYDVIQLLGVLIEKLAFFNKQLQGFIIFLGESKFVDTLVLVFKKIDNEDKIKYDTF